MSSCCERGGCSHATGYRNRASFARVSFAMQARTSLRSCVCLVMVTDGSDCVPGGGHEDTAAGAASARAAPAIAGSLTPESLVAVGREVHVILGRAVPGAAPAPS